MSMESASPATAPSPVVEERLEQIERLLFGLLPRSERLSVMETLETKVRALGARGEAALAEMPLPTATAGRERVTSQRRRSQLALTAGMLGIFAMLMLLAAPVTYVFIAMAEDVLGEMGAVVVAGTHGILLALGGFFAVTLGFVALFRLLRKRGQAIGHGWAITGMCAGPLPMLVGALGMLMIGCAVLEMEMFVAQAMPPQPVQVVSAVMPVCETSPPGTADMAMMPVNSYPAPMDGATPTDPSTMLPPATLPPVMPATPPADNPTLQYAPSPVSPATPPVMPETKAAEPQPPSLEAENELPKPEAKEEPAGETKEPAAEAATTTAETPEQPSKPAE